MSRKKDLSTYKTIMCKTCSHEFKTIPSLKREFCSTPCAQQYKSINKDWLSKRKETCLKKYGNEVAFKSKEVQDTYKNNLMKKYGVNNPFLVKEFKDKALSSIQLKYGTNVASKNKTISDKISKGLKNKPKNRKNFVEIKWEKIQYYCKEVNLEPLFDKEYLVNNKVTHSENNKFNFKCKLCNNVTEVYLSNGYLPSCVCTNFRGYSLIEEEIYRFLLDNMECEIQVKNRDILPNRLELDIYIPSLNVAIEINGIYWHSESMGKYKDYHLYKTEQCIKNGIQLLHIFDHEWVSKKPIIQSMLLNKLGLNVNKIYGRKCNVKPIIDTKILRQFLDDNHIQGYCHSKINLGLYYNNDLVSLMTFGKNRFKKHSNEWELIRFCNKLNTNVIGGAGKLFKHFKQNHTKVGDKTITFADRRFSLGKLYYNLGFGFVGNVSPSYFYWKYNLILNRMSCQKHKLSKLLDKFNATDTEYKNMLNNGFRRVWDCGNMKFEYITL